MFLKNYFPKTKYEMHRSTILTSIKLKDVLLDLEQSLQINKNRCNKKQIK